MVIIFKLMLNQKYLFIFFLLFNVYAPINTWAQTIKTNELGEKVVVFPDGSWKYYEAGDEKKYKINTPKGDKQKRSVMPFRPSERSSKQSSKLLNSPSKLLLRSNAPNKPNAKLFMLAYWRKMNSTMLTIVTS